jgi:hypothetical protein
MSKSFHDKLRPLCRLKVLPPEWSSSDKRSVRRMCRMLADADAAGGAGGGWSGGGAPFENNPNLVLFLAAVALCFAYREPLERWFAARRRTGGGIGAGRTVGAGRTARGVRAGEGGRDAARAARLARFSKQQ